MDSLNSIIIITDREKTKTRIKRSLDRILNNCYEELKDTIKKTPIIITDEISA